MKERGMIFNGEMVRAILDGRKTQTRRPIKWKQTRFTEVGEREDGSKWPWSEDAEHACDFWHPCPFGAVGDRIWVRETFCTVDDTQYGGGSGWITEPLLSLKQATRQAGTARLMMLKPSNGDHPSTCRAGQAAFCWKSPTCGLSG